jgi:hypothetical protein
VIAHLLLVGLCWWLWRPFGVAVGILATGNLRRIVVANAMFWATAGILIIGVLWGTLMAVAVHTVTAYATSSRILSAALYLEGLVAVKYIGYAPRGSDYYDKAGQTATVGMLCYLVVLIALLIIRGWPN